MQDMHMKPKILFLGVPLFVSILSGQVEAAPDSLTCDIGPVAKQFGGTNWIIYSCDDQRSLVIVSAPDNPASPFYFMLTPDESDYRRYGEGTVSQEHTSAAYEDLKVLGQGDIESLIAQTKQQQ